jgi:3-oxocholest-4-en-26-oyl-CoA dehydrogenase beta subunit
MDFSLSSDQVDLQELAARLLADRCTHEHLKQVTSSGGVDLDLWKEMGSLGLVGIGLPEAVGGGGLGFLEACVVLEQVGKHAAPLPALPVMAMAGPLLARAEARTELDGVAGGERIVTVALHEVAGDLWQPSARAEGGRLTGVKICAPFGTVAHAFVVSASDGVYLVAADAPGVTVHPEETTTGLPDAMVELDDVPARRLGGLDALEWMLEHGQAAESVILAGVCQTALAITAEYARNRTQFDRPIASFQAVSQRAADARIDTEAVRLTAWQAAARLDAGQDASEAVATAAFWAADGGQRVVHAAAHLHGGVGVDRDYPLHRQFLWAKQLELFLDGATPNLRRLGEILAERPV